MVVFEMQKAKIVDIRLDVKPEWQSPFFALADWQEVFQQAHSLYINGSLLLGFLTSGAAIYILWSNLRMIC